jgi:NADH-quinone oxidoreductase subunit F
VLSTLQYYRQEYEDHIHKGECAGRSCKPFIHFHVNENCNGCNLCVLNCPYEAVTGEKKKGDTYVIHQEKCTKCRICYQSCKFDAIDIKTGPLTDAA